jgi:acetylornithine/succinyldiaminopimelate/putrescine aminotransferase/predicted amino acid dehydrogenase
MSSNADYEKYARPLVARQLAAVGLDISYHRALGNSLFFRNERGEEREVSDFLGGYGACLFGHNHPNLLKVCREFFERSPPQWAQASIRSSAGMLARELSEVLQEVFGDAWVTTFASTGAEAVEAALKHARLAWEKQRTKRRTDLGFLKCRDFFLDEKAAGFFGSVSNAPTPVSVAVQDNIFRFWKETLECPPVILSVEGAYHGKTKGALEVTHNHYFKEGFLPDASEVVFLSPHACSMADALARFRRSLPIWKTGPAGFILSLTDYYPVVCLLLEPLQGEGGIHPLKEEVAGRWQEECRRLGIPLIVDEIQCGMSRTGTFCFSSTLGLSPDYVLLSKSLGGGMAKISACSIRRRHYLEEFGLRHSSTFAEDEFSAEVAREALRMATDAQVLTRIRNAGDLLMTGLRQVAGRFPDLIREVRGAGLMAGLEWRQDIPFRSTTLGFFHREGLLGYLIAGYLLRAYGIRVAPALGQGRVLRMEPSCFVSDGEIGRLIDGLFIVCEALRKNSVQTLLGPVLGLESSRVDETRISFQRTWDEDAGLARVAFIGHFIRPEDLGLWDPYLANLDIAHYESLLNTMPGGWSPQVYDRIRVEGADSAVSVHFIGLPVSSAQMQACLEGRDLERMRELIGKAVDLAIQEGCRVAGLGGYTSILTRNGKWLQEKPIRLTTGNSYTVATALQALTDTAGEMGVNVSEATAAVVGAGGNIGSAMSRLLAGNVARLLLIGRPGRLSVLEGLRCQILEDYPSMSPDALVVTTDLSALREAGLIACASNAPNPLVFPDMLHQGRVVICDISVPGDVDESVVLHRPKTRIIRGGVVRSSRNPGFHIPGIPLPPGHLYACMTETILMGLEGLNTHFSLGDIRMDQVRIMEQAARRHGFFQVVPKVAPSY